MQSIFKSYDIRGKYPSEINERIVREIVAAIVCKLAKTKGIKKFIVARDIRLSSPLLYNAAIQGARAIKGVLVIKIGLATTPMFYFLVNHFNAIGGAMITASHNPPEYNGLKIVKEKAIPLSGTEIYELL